MDNHSHWPNIGNCCWMESFSGLNDLSKCSYSHWSRSDPARNRTTGNDGWPRWMFCAASIASLRGHWNRCRLGPCDSSATTNGMVVRQGKHEIGVPGLGGGHDAVPCWSMYIPVDKISVWFGIRMTIFLFVWLSHVYSPLTIQTSPLSHVRSAIKLDLLVQERD